MGHYFLDILYIKKHCTKFHKDILIQSKDRTDFTSVTEFPLSYQLPYKRIAM